MILTTEQVHALAQCDGKHDSMESLFNCESCAILLNDTEG